MNQVIRILYTLTIVLLSHVALPMNQRNVSYGTINNTKTTTLDPIAEESCCCTCWGSMRSNLRRSSAPQGRDSLMWKNPLLIPLKMSLDREDSARKTKAAFRERLYANLGKK